MQHLRTKGLRPRSVETTEQRLFALSRDALGKPVVAFTERTARELYAQYAVDRSPDTHRNTLGQARTWFRWLQKQRWVSSNPWLDVEPSGRRTYGKVQLRVSEARALYRFLECTLSDDRSLACAIALLLGLRASEIVGLGARDVDAGGSLLWITAAKTRAGVRELDVPPVLRPALVQRTHRERLLPYRREWVRDAALWACDCAGVAPVGAHALRGLHATLAVSAASVATDLGHSGPAVTVRNYIAPGTLERATAHRVAAVLSSAEVPQAQSGGPSDAQVLVRGGGLEPPQVSPPDP